MIINYRTSLEELQKIYKKVAAATNRKIDTFYDVRKLRSSPAYKKLMAHQEDIPFTPSKKISMRKIDNINQLRFLISILNEFNESETSTITGWNKIIRKRDAKAASLGIKPQDRENFLKFLGSEKVKKMKNKYDSDVLVDVLAIAFIRNADNMEEIIEKFEKSKRSLAQWKYDLLNEGEKTFEL